MSGKSFGLCVLQHLYLVRLFVASCAISFTSFRKRNFEIRTFSFTNFSRYEPYTIRTLSCTNICIELLLTNLLQYEFFFHYELSHTNRLHTNYICYELLYEPYPVQTFYTTNFCHYELFTVRTLSHTEPYVYELRSGKQKRERSTIIKPCNSPKHLHMALNSMRTISAD